MTPRQLLRNAANVRIAYGLLSLFAPRLLFKLSGKPVQDEPRYFNALFGGRDISVAAVMLAALRSGREREALIVNASCDATDVVAFAQELRARGGMDQTLAAAAVFSLFGWATNLAAWRRL